MGHLDRDTICTLNELGARYARHVDRRDFAALAEVFHPDASIGVFPGDPATHQPLYVLDGLAGIQQAFELLRRYTRTFHFVGQQLLLAQEADGISGETYCIAHHLHEKAGVSHDFVMYIRYQDRFTKIGGAWKFAQRQLIVDRTEGEDVDTR